VNLHSSLKALKKDLARKETTLKTLYSLYPDLKGCSEVQLLAYFEVRTFEALQQHIRTLQPPQQQDRDLKERPVCSCTDSKGVPKSLYETEEDAEKEVRAGTREANRRLSVYPCPSGCGWHLTKR